MDTQAEEYLLNKNLTLRLDSTIAQQYLQEYLPGRSSYNKLDERIETLLASYHNKILDYTTLQSLSEVTSPDFATLYFIVQTWKNEKNLSAQQQFEAFIKSIKAGTIISVIPKHDPLFTSPIVFVPGFAHKTDPTTGADFASQRTFLKQYGFNTILLQINEIGSVEENGSYIAQELLRLSQQYKSIILVSASKASPEVALALGKELQPEQTHHIKAWISIGGLLRGTPLADQALSSWSKSIIARLVFLWNRFPIQLLKNLSTLERRPSFESLHIPAHIFTLQYIGVPLSSHITNRTRARYRDLKKLGPNDGLTLLADESVPNGTSILDIGLDHYYLDQDINTKTLALTYLVFKTLQNLY